MKDFLDSVVRAAGAQWKVLQADQDSAFLSEPVTIWLKKQLIALQLSAPYTHDQNGMVERDMGTLLDKARSMMAQYNCPEKYWGYAVECAAYLLNRTSTPRSLDCTPFEEVFKEIPDVSHLVPFYAPGVFHLTKDERKGKTWAHKAEPCRMLGYAEGEKNSYLVLNVRTGAVTSRRDCVFDESFFQALREARQSGDSIGLRALFDLHAPAEADAAGPGISGNSGNVSPLLPAEPAEPESASDKPASDFHLHPVVPDPDPVAASDGVEAASPPLSGDKEPARDPADSDADGETDVEEDDIAVQLYLLHEDWICSTACAATASSGVLSLPPQPVSVRAALDGPDSERWVEAISKELKQLEDLKVFDIAEKQEGHGMKTKLVLRVSYDNNFAIKYKARLVCCGYSQVRFRDFDATYAPTVTTGVVFLVLHTAGNRKLFTGDFDVTAAFLQADNDYENYAWLPVELIGKRVRVLLLKALYGEKQAPKLWSELLNRILLELGFERCPVAPCLYLWSNGTDYAILVVHVDDGTLAVTDERIFAVFMEAIHKHLPKVTLMRPLKKYVGINIHHDLEAGIVKCDQSLFIEKLFAEKADRHEVVPMCPSYNLRASESNFENESLLPVTGKLRYLCDRTRPDLLVAAGEIASGGAIHPSDNHVRTAEKSIAYLRSTVDECLVLGGLGKLELFGFCDASYLPAGKSRSRLGGCLFLGYEAGAFTSYSVLADLIAQSACHAEIQSIDHMVRLVLHFLEVLYFLGIYKRDAHEPVKIFTDSASSIELCSVLKVNPKTSAMNMRVNFIRECLNRRVISLHFVPGKLNVADLLTKALGEELFLLHRTTLLRGFGGYAAFCALLGHTALIVDSAWLVAEEVDTETMEVC
jgi:hypothetical protein